MNPLAIILLNETDWDGFVQAVRFLARQSAPPERVLWRMASQGDRDLFGATRAVAVGELPSTTPLRLPASFVDLARLAFLHKSRTRFDILYRTVWRIGQDRRCWRNPLDPDRLQLEHMSRLVRREMHRMKAFVRFRRLVDAEGNERHVAWFEPQHLIVEAVAPFFVERFGARPWAILTPRVSVAWDGDALRFAPEAKRKDAPPPDAGEALWLTYYQSIFNPARLKIQAMKQGMPVRYWANLPETAVIGALATGGPART